MKTIPLARWFLLLASLLPACLVAADTAPQVVPLGNDTYSVTVTAKDKFTRNTQKLKAKAMDAANQFCAREGKQFLLVSAAEQKSMYLVGDFANTTITFKALAAGSPELAAPTTARPPAPVMATPTDALYSEIMKLDELRKKGLLTDDEFTAEKKKVLDRSK